MLTITSRRVITARLFQPGGHTREMTGFTGCDRP
jgi:hypothetical protein